MKLILLLLFLGNCGFNPNQNSVMVLKIVENSLVKTIEKIVDEQNEYYDLENSILVLKFDQAQLKVAMFDKGSFPTYLIGKTEKLYGVVKLENIECLVYGIPPSNLFSKTLNSVELSYVNEKEIVNKYPPPPLPSFEPLIYVCTLDSATIVIEEKTYTEFLN